jgi:4,5-DOPA dioxygenase extradiol
VGPPLTAPAAFLGHGNPMNALEDNVHTRAWRRFGEACGRPRAVLVVSAHWYLNASAVTAMAHPRTIHDFYGFPRELHEFVYPAPGSSEVAREVAEVCGRDRVALDEESWGLDHGTWSVLAHCFPHADIPVVQLAINALQPFEYHVELGRRLAPLRETGVVIVGSGNLVHNLRRIRWETTEGGFDWAGRFDAAVRRVVRGAETNARDPAH